MRSLSSFIVTAVAATVTLVPGWAWAQAPSDADRYGYGPHMMWWDGGWHGLFLGPLFMILILAAVVALIVLLVRWIGGSSQTAGPNQAQQMHTPLDILKERFARGEIDKEEFEERRKILGA